ncbi:MAG: hypothetical protein P4M11_03595 [Candidatus Pacebacteria bacterium]|nr:hypothetical protein [Candidatus Paceibacterota bacterium]
MEPKLDIVDYIDDHLDLAGQKVQQETKQLRAVASYFQTLHKELGHFGKAAQKALAGLKTVCCSAVPHNEWELAVQKTVAQSEDLAKSLLGVVQGMGAEVADPIEDFVGKYESYNKTLLKDAKKVVEALDTQRVKIKRAKERYYRDIKAVADSNSAEELHDRTQDMNESRGDYKQLVAALNAYIDKNEETYRKDLELLRQNEEKKLEQLKRTFSRFSEVFAGLAKDCEDFCGQTLKEFEAGKTAVEPKDYLQSSATAKTRLFNKAAFEEPDSAEASANLSKAKAMMVTVSAEEEKSIDRCVTRMLEDNPVSKDQHDKLLGYARVPEGRKVICGTANTLSRKVELANPECFAALGDMVLAMLDSFMEQRSIDSAQVASILVLGGLVANVKPKTEETKGQKNKRYLREVMSNHCIWHTKDLWPGVLEYKIAKSVAHLHAYLKMRQEKQAPEKPTGFMSKIAAFMGKKDAATIKKKEEQEEAGTRGIVFSELASTTLEMALLSVDALTTRGLAIEWARKYEIENDKLYQLLCDYECAQPLPRDDEPKLHELIRYSLDKRDKERKRYGYSKNTLVLGISFKFIADCKTLFNILAVNKEWREVFKEKVYKHALRCSVGKSRFALWRSILKTEGLDELYLKLKTKGITDFMSDSKYIDDVIRLDVIRSFHVHSEADQLVFDRPELCL